MIGNAPSLRSPFAREDVQGISRKLGAEYLIIGQLKSDGQRLRLVAHLIRVSDMKHLWANTYDDVSFALDAQQRVAESVAAAVVVSLTVQDRWTNCPSKAAPVIGPACRGPRTALKSRVRAARAVCPAGRIP